MNVLKKIKSEFNNIDFTSFSKIDNYVYFYGAENNLETADGLHIIRYDLNNDKIEDKFVIDALIDWKLNLNSFEEIKD